MEIGLREGLGGQCPGGLPGFPGLRILTPYPHPAFPLGSHPQPMLATGNRKALVPRGDSAKALPSSGKSWGAFKSQGEEDGEGQGLWEQVRSLV